MKRKIYYLLKKCGYVLAQRMETSVVFERGATAISVSDSRMLVTGDKEHVITLTGLDEYDVAFMLQVLKLIDLDLDISLYEPTAEVNEQDAMEVVPHIPKYYWPSKRKAVAHEA